MAKAINFKELRSKLELFDLPAGVRQAVLKEVLILQKIQWLTPKEVIKLADVKKNVDEALKLFEAYEGIKPDFLELDTISNWSTATGIETGKRWNEIREEAAARVTKIAETKAREDAKTAIIQEVSDSILQVVEGRALKIAETLANIGGEAIPDLETTAKEVARNALFDSLSHLTWILDSDLIKGHLAENRFAPLIELWKMGLWPIGVAKIGGIAKFWIGLPPAEDKRLPRLV